MCVFICSHGYLWNPMTYDHETLHVYQMHHRYVNMMKKKVGDAKGSVKVKLVCETYLKLVSEISISCNFGAFPKNPLGNSVSL